MSRRRKRASGAGESGFPAGPVEIPVTELPNPASRGIDILSTREIVGIIHNEDRHAWKAVEDALDVIARVVEQVVEAFQVGGRLFYVGAGTSGRLGVLDASECPPTFGVTPDRVVGIIAGGDRALRSPIEGAEDSAEDGRVAIRAEVVRAQDVVCGIAASGTTPFVWGALEEAEVRDATTVLVTCNTRWGEQPHAKLVDYCVLIPVGPEILAGSSRLKAGTATKLVLNTISTASMIRWGKVYDNLMVDVRPLSSKLRRRARGLVSTLGKVNLERAEELLAASGGEVKTAIVVGRRGVDPIAARELLDRHGGILRRALEDEDGD
jgi:N-acetylmuramic acid 6-phosphate etherase